MILRRGITAKNLTVRMVLILMTILITAPLNYIQNTHLPMPNVNGVKHYLMPKDFSSVIDGHSIDNILKNFGVNLKRYSK